jgi:hypothetical protein
MKKFYLIGFVIWLPLAIVSQTLLNQNFSSGVWPPSGWTISGYTAQWSLNQGNQAGGTLPEGKFTYISATGTSYFISPNINTTGKTQVILDFRQYLDHYSSGYSVGVSTRASGGAWHNVWTVSPTGNIGPELKSIIISNSDVGSSAFQFCFLITGNLYNIDYWYIDDISLFAPYNLDASLIKITTPDIIVDYDNVTGILKNSGITTINSLEVKYQIDNGDIYLTPFDGLSITLNSTYSFTCTAPVHLPLGIYNLKVWISKVNGIPDNDPSNDMLTKTIQLASHVVNRKPCFEEFTSSTCPPCATFNSSFVPWCTSHVNDITLIKYQMNWPSPGDPYYTTEGGVRRSYYGVTWVPWLDLNGNFIDTDITAVQTGYNNALLQPGMASIVSSFTLSGTTMNIHATILPYANFNNCRIHLVVFEYITTGNVGTNGETQFHHVMMKMVPDANGTSVNLTERVPFVLNQNVNLSGTHIEEWNDLGVAVILQNYTTKEVYQSAYSAKNGVFSNNALLSDLKIDGITVPGFLPEQYNYIIELPYGTEEIPIVQAVCADPAATPIVIQTFTLPGTSTVDVFAQNLQTHSTYSLNFIISENYEVELKAFLEGPFDGTEMKNSLNIAGQLPITQPFSIAPWNYNGLDSLIGIPNSNIVDWILVELRDAVDATFASAATIIARQAGLVLKDGSIVGTDGFSKLQFNNAINHQLFVVVWHRNHLGILSKYSPALADGIFNYNFTDGPNKIYGSPIGFQELSPGIYGMKSGDCNSDGLINEEDKNNKWQFDAGFFGYLQGDIDRNGQCNNLDKNDFLIPNLGSECQVPE